MKPLHRTNACLVGLALISAVATTSRLASAQTFSEQARSLRLAPVDAAFYSANLRMKEQWDIITASKAYARLLQIPLVQGAKLYVEFQLQESPEPTIARIREFASSAQGKEAIELVKDMFSDEAFAYGSADAGEVFGLLLELNSISQSAQFEALASQQVPDEIIKRRLMEWLEAHKDQLKLPDAVIGFRVRDGARATRHLGALEQHVKALLAEHAPEIAANVNREQIGGREFVTLRLAGSMLPWDQLRAMAAESPAEEFEKWKMLVSGKTLVVALGLVDEFLIASIGDSTSHLEKLGQGASMASHPSLVRVARHANERVTALSFASGEFLNKVSSPERSLNNAADLAVGLLEQAPITPEQRTKLSENIRGLVAAIVKYLPQPGNLTVVNTLTPRGYQMFRYNEGTLPSVDASQPLAVLNHLGGNPMFFLATHARDSIDDYNLGINWIKRFAVDLEQLVQQFAPTEHWANYLKYRERGLELLQRLDRANREQIIPSMKANEQAIVLDVASKSERWFAPIPRSPQPLPMFELGLVSRVNDAELLKKGVAEYAAVVKDALALLHEIDSAIFPQIALPPPDIRTTLDSTVYSYPFPPEWGVDSQLAVNAGLTNDALAVTLMPAFTKQLLKPEPLAIDTAIDVKRPAGMVMHFQFAKLIGAIRPWIDYGVGVASGRILPDGAEPDPDAEQAILLQLGLIMPQVEQLLDVFTTFRSQTSITYREDGVWVTQTEMHIKDLE